MNHTTRTFPRTSREAFGLDATEANPIQCYRTPLYKRALWAFARWGWMLIFLLVLVLTGCSGDMRYEQAAAKELQAIQQEEAAQASRDYVGKRHCGPGAVHEWIDDKTVQCVPKRGKSWQVAGVR
jgi:hypothetical protein